MSLVESRDRQRQITLRLDVLKSYRYMMVRKMFLELAALQPTAKNNSHCGLMVFRHLLKLKLVWQCIE